MIVSASYKTDIPAFFGDWFRRRLAAGACRVINPYNGKPFSVSLDPGTADGFVFWTRNAGPFAAALADVRARGFPFIVQFTVTGYPRGLDRATVAAERAAAQIADLARCDGPRAVVWRYDPIAITSLTPPDWHRANFARLARSLRGTVDEVAVSFMQVYRKTKRNLDAAARAHGFAWRDPEANEKTALLADFAAIAADNGMRLTLCGQPELLNENVSDARCIDAERLSDVAGKPIRALRKAHRKECGCWASKDIGAYDTCPHGCVYCYAVRSRETAKENHRGHDPASAVLK